MNSIKKWLNREVTWGILKDMERQKYIKNLEYRVDVQSKLLDYFYTEIINNKIVDNK